MEELEWHPYPKETPLTVFGNDGKYTMNVIIMDKNGNIENNVYYSEIDSKHDHSIWQTVKWWICVEELRKIPKYEIDYSLE